jgi:hypothetical protein
MWGFTGVCAIIPGSGLPELGLDPDELFSHGGHPLQAQEWSERNP